MSNDGNCFGPVVPEPTMWWFWQPDNFLFILNIFVDMTQGEYLDLEKKISSWLSSNLACKSAQVNVHHILSPPLRPHGKTIEAWYLATNKIKVGYF